MSTPKLDRLREAGIELYPSRSRRSKLIKELRDGEDCVLAGRMVYLNLGLGLIQARLKDESGVVELSITGSGLEGGAYQLIESLLEEGDIVEAAGTYAGSVFQADDVRILAKSLHPWKQVIEKRGNWVKLIKDLSFLEIFRLRSDLIHYIRTFFRERGFIEVETPALALRPGMEIHLSAMESEYRDGAGRRVKLYLQTSPEYAMKRLLVGGMEKIFQITKGFRNGEASKLHSPEFTILEWYRAYDSFTEIMADTEELISELALRLKGGKKMSYQGQEIDLTPPWERITVKDAMLEYAGIDLDICKNVGDFRREAELKGHKFSDEPDWDTIFFTIFLQEVEPKLGRGRPTFLIDYPARFGALAKRKSDDPEVVERFEVYIAGLELANAFTELNDPVEQRSRLMIEREERIGLGKESYPIDEDFLYALECAMPPAGGIALGVDRLVMLLADRPTIEDVVLFPFSQMTGIVEAM